MATREQRAAWGRIGAHIVHATHDSTEITAPARRAFLASFEKKVDPDGILDPAERSRRAAHLHRAHMQKLAQKSAAARRKR